MIKKSFVLAILIVFIDLSTVCAIQRETQRQQQAARQTNSTQQVPIEANQDAGQRESLEAAPTITSVHHQVWTSSTSGRLDELSPELIGKLRQDVPFLAAYALRPRLVGQQQQQSSSLVEEDQIQQPAGSKSYETLVIENDRLGGSTARNGTGPLQVGASEPQATRQSLGPSRIGDFSEFKVETSSLSKSEHHHKRSTSLRRPNKSNSAKRSARARTTDRTLREDSLSQLVRRVKGRRSSANRRRPSGRRSGRGSSRRRRGRRGGERGRRRSSGSKRLRSDRLLQDPKVEANDLESTLNRSGIKGGDVKGGGRPSAKKTPFFAAGLKPKTDQAASTSPSVLNNAGDSNDIDLNIKPNETKKPDNNNDDGEDKDLENDIDDANEEDDNDSKQEPKRVGDDDVEEDGDTVLVEPKSDGVDDDPELPSAEDDEMADKDVNKEDDSVDTPDKVEEGQGMTVTTSEGDARGNRVNRQRPNELPPSSEGDGNQVIGGGVGATTGSGGAAPDDQDRKLSGKGNDAMPGVEFANDDDGDERSTKNDKDEDRDDQDSGKELPLGGNESDRGNRSGDDTPDGNFGERTRSGQGPEPNLPRSPNGESAKKNDIDDDIDLDYRDESERSDDKPATGGRVEPRGEHPNGVNASRGHSKATVEHCEDGSYDHHSDHHHDDHHHHHDTIDWLRGAIPGEPNADYPILSRANATDFSCADQKFPGYYADVDARCQIFHICQADGRQDSFLCPNGTIFSQRSLVCVWWNGFHCEDAPKFYHLNELLYKTTNGNDSPQSAALPNLRPLDGSPQHPRPKAMDAVHNDEEDDSAINSPPIDGPMRGRKPHEAKFSGSETGGVGADTNRPGGSSLARGQVDARDNKIAPDDDAIIQRKSTDLDYDSPDELRQAKNSVSRRRRRASMRQAPPKLKSRRVSRNSRRAKLRHGIKPRRRA